MNNIIIRKIEKGFGPDILRKKISFNEFENLVNQLVKTKEAKNKIINSINEGNSSKIRIDNNYSLIVKRV